VNARPISPQPSSFGPLGAAASYLLVALAFTWPLVRGLTRDVPWDLGDSLLNIWILGWDADHLLRFIGGEFGALKGFWNANIFYPEPLTLAYSEHLFAQAVQILPIFALTHNLILCYNLLFLSTFVLSGLGVFLFVREVTGSTRAAWVAGLIYAFAPLRVPQFAHVQVISSQWMPFALYGMRRYFDTRRVRPLAGAAASLIAQNLSCGYFLLYFAPFIVMYVVFEIATRKVWTDRRVWTAMAVTAVVAFVATLPFLLPYLELRRLGFPPRPIAEVETYSADVYSYWTAAPELHVWGRVMRAYPKPEGDLFPSATALGLGAIALAVVVRSAWSRASRWPLARTPKLVLLVYLIVAGCAVYTAFTMAILFERGFSQIGPLPIAVRSLGRTVQVLGMLFAALLILSIRVRVFVRESLGTPAGFVLFAVLLAVVMSLGPEVHSLGREVRGTGPYSLFYWHVPGYDGLRVPARFAMLVMLFLSIASGFGALHIERSFKWGGVATLLIGMFAIGESFAAPIVINGTAPPPVGNYASPPARLFTGDQIPPVYKFLQTQRAPGTVVVEFPLGEWAYELSYVYYSTTHWHPLINGYSGTFPLSYTLRAGTLRRPEENPEAAWLTLVTSGATHAVVHEGFYKDAAGRVVTDWLAAHGARLAGQFGSDKVFLLK
jgi:hypothetical protein